MDANMQANDNMNHQAQRELDRATEKLQSNLFYPH